MKSLSQKRAEKILLDALSSLCDNNRTNIAGIFFPPSTC